MSAIFVTESKSIIFTKLKNMSFGLVTVLIAIAGVGFLALYSAGGGALLPWAIKHLIRFGVGFAVMVGIAFIDIRVWYRLAWPIYIGGIVLLLLVEVMGHVGMGAQRWIDLGFMRLQPSEFMKIAIVVILARYFHGASYADMRRLRFLLIPAGLLLFPVVLVMMQPDLGTSLMLLFCGAAIAFIAGAPLWIYGFSFIGSVASVPIAWQFMHDYQKRRVMTFLNPETDPLGSGYHITQSKIALGSGGIEGKGFLEGSQSRLNFLPEKQTDFIFTLWAEEWGLLGGLFLLGLFAVLFFYGFWIAFSVRSNFAKYLALGISINFSLYVFINIAMVTGLIPVIGAPLPLISYGGTSMLAVMSGYGLMLSALVHRDVKIAAP